MHAAVIGKSRSAEVGGAEIAGKPECKLYKPGVVDGVPGGIGKRQGGEGAGHNGLRRVDDGCAQIDALHSPVPLE
jgi:hypothetical protein